MAQRRGEAGKARLFGPARPKQRHPEQSQQNERHRQGRDKRRPLIERDRTRETLRRGKQSEQAPAEAEHHH
jgi:hypothetical protein